jgi:hypothetical protein
MPGIDEGTQIGADAGGGRQLQEYFAGITGIPLKEDKHPVALSHSGPPARTGPPAASEADEVNRLRQLIHEKDHAMFRAVVSANELRGQLDETRAEADTLKLELAQVHRFAEGLKSADDSKEKLTAGKQALSPEAQEEIGRQRKEWMRVQKSLEREHLQRKAELVQVRGHWFATQQQLEQEVRARRSERGQTASRISSLERSLEAANTTIAGMRGEKGKSAVKRSLVTVFAIAALLVAVAVGGGVIWKQAPGAVVSASATGTMHPQPPQKAVEVPESVLFPRKGIQASLGRLNRALSAFGSAPAEEVLRRARVQSGDPSICAFEWNHGQPSVIFNGGGLKESLSASLNRCAVAVEGFK